MGWWCVLSFGTANQTNGAVVSPTTMYVRAAARCVLYCSTVSCTLGTSMVVPNLHAVGDPTAGLVLPLYVVQQ
jgi:hypothetical protein